MAVELAFARMLSVALVSHYAFVAISLAMFGIGLGGLVVYLLPGRFPPGAVDRQLRAGLAWFAVATVASEWTFLHVHVTQELSFRGIASLTAAYVVLSVPFLCAGLVVSVLMTHFARRIGPVYAADLLGAGLGCLVAVGALTAFAAPIVPLLAAAAAAATALALERRGRGRVAVACVLVGVALWAGLDTNAFRMRYVKIWQSFYADDEAWNAFSRVAVFGTGEDAISTVTVPAGRYRRPGPALKWIDIDGTAWTPMFGWDGRLGSIRFLRDAAVYAAYRLRPRGDVAVIGTGGGRDLLGAMVAKERSIRGIELNPLMGRMVEDVYAGFSGRPYSSRGVHVDFAEGRSALPAIRDTFDVLQLSLVDTFAAGAAGGFVFAENYLYTTEALREYFRHLRPAGLLSITRFYIRRYPVEILRLVGMARAAWEAEGVGSFDRHVVVLTQGVVATMLANRSPFTPAEVSRIERLAADLEMQVAWAPGAKAPGDPALAALLQAPDRAAYYRTHEYRIDPATDDRPFFFDFVRHPVADVGPDPFGFLRMWNDAHVLMRMLLGVVTGCAALFFVGPLLVAARMRHAAAPRAVAIPALLYFVCLGYGFMAVEIPLLQRLVLLVGYPTYALALGLGGLLVAGGAGSLVSPRLGVPRDALPRVLVAVVVAIAAYALVLPRWIALFLAAGLFAKVVAGLVVLAPIGLLLGTCYPLGIGVLTDADPTLVPWAWGLNGATSVVASVLAVLIGSRVGFTATLLTGAAAYAVALGLVLVTARVFARRGAVVPAAARAASGLSR